MVTKSTSRFFVVVLLCMTMPIRQVFASMPEVRPLPMQQMDLTVPFAMDRPVSFSRIQFIELDPVVLDSHVLDSLLETEQEVVVPGLPPGLTLDNIEEKLQDDLLIPGQERAGTKKKIALGVGLLLAASLITALFAFLVGGGSGSGSGSGSGGGAGSGDGGNPGTGEGGGGGNGGPQGTGGGSSIIPLVPPPGGKDGGEGDGGGNGDPEGGFNENQQLNLFSNLPKPYQVPSNPEPATMLLTLLGLGLPLVRKRFTK